MMAREIKDRDKYPSRCCDQTDHDTRSTPTPSLESTGRTSSDLMDSYEKEGQEVKEHVVDDVPAPKLGRHGVILVPRPSDHPQDPLVSRALKSCFHFVH